MMMDNQHQKISGYRDLKQEEIDLMNVFKEAEARLSEMLGQLDLGAKTSGDPAMGRWASLARTHLETGFMFAIKAVARPNGGLGRKE